MEPVSTAMILVGRQDERRGKRDRRRVEKLWSVLTFRPRGAAVGRLLLVGAELEVLGGQFEAQGVGSQRVDHVLVAFSTVLHQEGTPVGLRGADQLQTLREEERKT